ncbi:MAG: hypothetical protein AAGL92_12200 [Pseudomonadota bacterium]
MLATGRINDASVSDVMEKTLHETVVDRSTIGARFHYALPISGAAGLNITKQYVDGDWDWVVVNGGGNDLWMGCGCMLCAAKIDRLISEDGTKGTIPASILESLAIRFSSSAPSSLQCSIGEIRPGLRI